MSDFVILAIGARVLVGIQEQFPGTILGACLRTNRVTYEVVWWDGRNRRLEWLDDTEVTPVGNKDVQRIGFSQGGT